MALDVPYRSIPDMLLRRVAETPDGRALGYPTPDEQIAWLSWREVGEQVAETAAGLIALGVRAEDRVAILSNTRAEWIVADLGVMCAGGATTTVYPTTEPDDATFIVADSGSRVLIAEDATQLAKMRGGVLPDLTHVVLIDPAPEAEIVTAGLPVPVLTLAELRERGATALAGDPGLVNRVVEGIRPDQLATLIYTSGTTGRPKGVELLHAGWCWEAVAQADTGTIRDGDIQYLWLPLSHSFGKTLTCGMIHVGVPTYVDGRVEKLVENLGRVRPTLMCAAPRVFEKVYNAAVTTAQAGGGAKAKIFSWAVRNGVHKVTLEQAGRPVPLAVKAQHAVADRLVFSKLRAKLGGNMRILVSGSAPLAKSIAEFFAAAGLPIMEGYGLTESSAGNFVNRPGGLKIGTVGQRLGDLEITLDEDGEILLRGTPVMRGYHNLPDETAAALTEDGFLRTGDIGELDGDGFLRITDRKKDLIKTSGGKYVAPSYIEGMFKAVCPYAAQALVIGQARNYCTMLVTLDPDGIRSWVAGGPLEGRPYEEIAASPQAREMVAGYVKELNERLNRWETIKKFTILTQDLSIEDGHLTPSMKVKRRAVERTFAAEVDKMYTGAIAEM